MAEKEGNSFPKGKLEKNCRFRGHDNGRGQTSVHIFKAKQRLFYLKIFKRFC